MKKIVVLFTFTFSSLLFSELLAQCWQTVSAGMDHSIAIKPNGTLWGWGFNGNGQLGIGSTIDQKVPIQIGVASDWTVVSAGGNHNLAIKTDGSLWSWGQNMWGEVGDGTVGTDQLIPKQIGNDTDWKSVCASPTFSFGIKTNGTLWAWGENIFGQLGIGSTSGKLVPTKVGSDTNWKSLAVGSSHVIALKTDGTLWSWGFNANGQLGIGTTIDEHTPIQVGTSTNWIAVTAGNDFSLAIKDDGTLWSWGNNTSGALGDGTYSEKLIPTRIGSSTQWTTVSAGGDFVQAQQLDGTLWVWGWIIGRFGTGQENTRPSPTQLDGTNWTYGFSGNLHAFCFRSDGSLWGWGDNTWGKLGINSWEDKQTPVSIAYAPTGPSSQSFCQSGFVSDLAAIGSDVRWYISETGGLALAADTPLIDGQTYYATQTVAQCESNPRMITLVSISQSVPALPTGSAIQKFCGTNVTIANLKVTGTSIKWYNVPSGGTPLPSSTPLVHGAHYFATQTQTVCESARLDVEVVISTTPTPTGSTTQQFCPASKIKEIIANGENIKWYTATTGGTLLTGNENIVNGTYYYATQTINGIESCGRFAVRAFVNVSQTLPPSGQSSQTFCNEGVIANLKVTGANIKWFLDPIGGSPLSSGTILLNGTHYYASQTQGSCESKTRFEVTANINTTPTPAPSGNDEQRLCEGSTIENIQVTGTNVLWYLQVSGGTSLATGYKLIDNTQYFASQTIDACESATRIPVNISLATNNTPSPQNANPVAWNTTMELSKEYFSGMLKNDGTLWGWGANEDNEFGDASTTVRTVPTLITKANDWRIVSSGRTHTQAIKNDGTLWGWGYNYHGNLGDGGSQNRIVPTRIGTDTNWRTVAAGHYFTVAVKEDGTLWAWGDNYAGVFGDGTINNFRRVPGQIGTDKDWRTVFVYDLSVFAYKNDNTLWVWGENSKLGLGTADQYQFFPTQMGTQDEWRAISLGSPTLAIKHDGTLWAWGGWVGDGTKNGKKVPTQVGNSQWKAVSAGAAHALAIRSDGTLWTWGDNYYYQLGINDQDVNPLPKLVPVQVGTDSDWVGVVAGVTQSHATKSDGSLWGWGYNGYGEVGDGTRQIRYAPVKIYSESQTFCSAPTTLEDVKLSGESIKWYSTSTSLIPLAASTPISSGTFYYATQTVDACESKKRLAINITSGTKVSTPPIGSANQSFCDGARISDLQVEGDNIKWYDSESGTIELSKSNKLKTNTSYFATHTLGACESSSRLKVNVSLSPNLTSSPTAENVQEFCNGATLADLIVSGTNIQWYSTVTGTELLVLSELLMDGKQYYATQTIGGCESLSPTEITAKGKPTPVAPLAQELCEGNTINDLVAIGTDIKWYVSAEADSPLAGETVLQNGSHYYVSQSLNVDCESPRLDVYVTTKYVEPPNFIPVHVSCEGSLLQDIDVGNAQVKWYSDETRATPLQPTLLLEDDKYIYATQLRDGCESLEELMVHIMIYPIPPPPVAESPQTYFDGGILQNIVISGPAVTWYGSAEDAIAGKNEISPSTYWVDGATYYATLTLNGCVSSPTAVQVASITSVEDKMTAIKYFPNPANDVVYYSYDRIIEQVSILNLAGNTVLSKSASENEGNINISVLPSGVYFLKLTSGNNHFIAKIMKQ